MGRTGSAENPGGMRRRKRSRRNWRRHRSGQARAVPLQRAKLPSGGRKSKAAEAASVVPGDIPAERVDKGCKAVAERCRKVAARGLHAEGDLGFHRRHRGRGRAEDEAEALAVREGSGEELGEVQDLQSPSIGSEPAERSSRVRRSRKKSRSSPSGGCPRSHTLHAATKRGARAHIHEA